MVDSEGLKTNCQCIFSEPMVVCNCVAEIGNPSVEKVRIMPGGTTVHLPEIDFTVPQI